MVIKAIIGANYGDEGKGLMTDYLCYKALQKYGRHLNVLTNGGPQRGHTVVTPRGKRHVFHHFGSGTLVGAHTYIPKQFIVNPMVFSEEYMELKDYISHVYIHGKALVSTPYDMIYNKIKMEKEGIHNSCGYGVYETKHRSLYIQYTVMDFEKAYYVDKNIKDLLTNIRSYYIDKMVTNNIELSQKWLDIFYSEELINHFISDFGKMLSNSIIMYDQDVLFNHYEAIIFENGQGLLLDKDLDPDFGTSSNTGLKAVFDVLDNDQYTVEPVYVTRSYLTRHGDGSFPDECDLGFKDCTNVYNEFQGDLRYANLDYNELYSRIKVDMEPFTDRIITPKLAVTHCDELDWNDDFIIAPYYISEGNKRRDVTESQNLLLL